MDGPWETRIYAIVGVIATNAISLAGALLLWIFPRVLEKHLRILVSFAVGGLFGDAYIHLLPEAFAQSSNPLAVSLLCLLGIFIFMILERTLLWRHHREEARPASRAGRPGGQAGRMRPVVAMNLLGDGVHNFIDGILIGASFTVGPTLGVTTTVAVLLHELPQEIGDFGILIHGGLSPRRALAFNLLSSLSALLGTAFSLAIGPAIKGFPAAMLPITAGGFIYIAGSTLIPDLQKDLQQGFLPGEILAMAAGVGIMALLALYG